MVHEAVQQGYKAYMATMENIINTIKMKSLATSAMTVYNRLLKADLVAIDDIMLFSVHKEDAAGIFNLPHFIRVFTSTYGMSPSKFRK
ncbi:MAG: ATP-binding protein [Bacteroidales bacterium]|nr:ATP-binding protein [Bacteroidales bacterium]